MDAAVLDEAKAALVSVLGEERVLWRRPDLVPYTADTDISVIRSGEDRKHYPDLAVFPRDTRDVQEIVRLAAKHKIPLLPKGGGSNRTGMLLPTRGGIVVDTIKMDKVLEVSVPNLYVTVQPGITLKELEEELQRHGLALNQEQGSFKVATVGGSISTAGFGRKHQKYGTISDRIMSLEVVLADGSVLRTGPKVLYTSTGYRLSQLFVGAEGTLGIITEATLRVEPVPEAKDVIMVFFDDFWAAFEAAKRTMESGVGFVGSEVFELEDAAEYGGPKGRKGVFYVSLEGTRGEVEAQRAFVTKITQGSGGQLAEEEPLRRLYGKYTIQWCGLRAAIGLEEDFLPYIPMGRIKEFYERVWNDIMPSHGMRPTPDGKYSLDIGRYKMAYGKFMIPEGERGLQDYTEAYREILELAIELGGSVAGCTGIGLKHKDAMALEFSGVALETMWALKNAFDPDNIMNPGKKLPELVASGER